MLEIHSSVSHYPSVWNDGRPGWLPGPKIQNALGPREVARHRNRLHYLFGDNGHHLPTRWLQSIFRSSGSSRGEHSPVQEIRGEALQSRRRLRSAVECRHAHFPVLHTGLCVSFLLLKRDRDEDGHWRCALSRFFKRASGRGVLLRSEPRDARRIRYNASPQRPSLSVEFKNVLRRFAALELKSILHGECMYIFLKIL